MKSKFFIWLLCIIAGLCTGCALQSDVRILEDRIISLEMRNMELQQQTSEAEREKRRIKSQIKDYSDTLEQKEQALRSQSANLQVLSDRLRNEIQVVRGKLEETSYLLDQRIKLIEVSEKMNARRLETVERILKIDSGQSKYKNTHSAISKSNIKTLGNTSKPDTQENYSEQELYIIAKKAFDRGQYDLAREEFKKLLKNYPSARNADNAQFWIGEIYYREKNYENAILEYQTVIEKYPRGNKIKASLLKQGFAFYNIGDKSNAKLILQELISKYPGTAEAKAAQKKISGF